MLGIFKKFQSWERCKFCMIYVIRLLNPKYVISSCYLLQIGSYDFFSVTKLLKLGYWSIEMNSLGLLAENICQFKVPGSPTGKLQILKQKRGIGQIRSLLFLPKQVINLMAKSGFSTI